MTGNCEICHRFRSLDKHHVFGAGFRSKSEKYGAVVWICRECHNDLHHKHPAQYEWLKKQWQRRLMEEHGWNVDEFIQIFGRNYE